MGKDSKDSDDVSKLLGHIQLQGFRYRSFQKPDEKPLAASERPALRIVRSSDPDHNTTATPPAVEPAPVRPATAAPSASALANAPAAEAMEMGLDEVFSRLERGSLKGGAPRLDLRLKLPARTTPERRDADASLEISDILRDLQADPVPGVKPRNR